MMKMALFKWKRGDLFVEITEEYGLPYQTKKDNQSFLGATIRVSEENL